MSHASRRFPPDTLTVLSSEARTGDATSDTFDATSHSVPRIFDGVLLVVEVTAASGTPSVVFNLQTDDGSGFTTVLASAAVTGAGTTILVAHSDVPDATNLSAQEAITLPWRVFADHAETSSITYSVVGFYI